MATPPVLLWPGSASGGGGTVSQGSPPTPARGPPILSNPLGHWKDHRGGCKQPVPGQRLSPPLSNTLLPNPKSLLDVQRPRRAGASSLAPGGLLHNRAASPSPFLTATGGPARRHPGRVPPQLRLLEQFSWTRRLLIATALLLKIFIKREAFSRFEFLLEETRWEEKRDLP